MAKGKEERRERTKMSEWGMAEWVIVIGGIILVLVSGMAVGAAIWVTKVQNEVHAKAAEKEAAEREKQERISKGGYDKVTFIEAAGESEDGYRW